MSRSAREVRSIAVAGVVLVAGSLAACGGDGSSSSATAQGNGLASTAQGVFPIDRLPSIGGSNFTQGTPSTPSTPSKRPLPGPPGSGGLTALTVAWQAPTQNNDGTTLVDLRGYRVYYGHASHNYSDAIQVANPGITDYVVQNLTPGHYYFAVTAYNSAGQESAPSTEVATSVN